MFDKYDLPFLANDINQFMPIKTNTTLKIPFTFGKFPKSLKEEFNKKQSKFLDNYSSKIESAFEKKLMTPNRIALIGENSPTPLPSHGIGGGNSSASSVEYDAESLDYPSDSDTSGQGSIWAVKIVGTGYTTNDLMLGALYSSDDAVNNIRCAAYDEATGTPDGLLAETLSIAKVAAETFYPFVVQTVQAPAAVYGAVQHNGGSLSYLIGSANSYRDVFTFADFPDPIVDETSGNVVFSNKLRLLGTEP